MKRLLLLAVLVACVGCQANREPLGPNSKWTVFGKCRFCGNPGYSAEVWIDSDDAQERADKGDPKVAGSIVCGACRKKMEVPK